MGALLCLSRKAPRLQWEFGALQADLSALIAYVTFLAGAGGLTHWVFRQFASFTETQSEG